MICNDCPRQCSVDREKSKGFCNSGNEIKLARAALHYWEEPCISGKRGSGAVFFSGCNLRCAYCQNYEISTLCNGKIVSDERFVEICENLIKQGANNINLVNPSHYAKHLANILSYWKPSVPIVYNTSSYDSVETLKVLNGKIDIYLADYKYTRESKARDYSLAPDYPSVALDAIREMRCQVDDAFDNGMMKSGVIIRHLILPSNTNSSIEALNILHNEFEDTYISLMAQYTPCGDIKNHPELARKITKREYDKVSDYAISLNHEKLFLQELSSAKEKYIPSFDFTGIM